MKLALTLLALAALALAQSAPHAMLPDARITPGVADPRVTQATIQQTICQAGYTATVRSVSTAEKKAVLHLYALPDNQLHLVEIDHFLSLEVGGSNDLKNLWPQYYSAAKGQTGYLGAREKDVVETWLHRQVCAGKMTLAAAQAAIREWPQWYVQIKGGK